MEKEQIIRQLGELVSSNLELGLQEIKKILSDKSPHHSSFLSIIASYQLLKNEKLKGTIDFEQLKVTQAQIVERTLAFISICSKEDFNIPLFSDSNLYFDLKLIDSRLKNLESNLQQQNDNLQAILAYFETNPPANELLEWWENLPDVWKVNFSRIVGANPSRSDIEHLWESTSLNLSNYEISSEDEVPATILTIRDLSPLRHFAYLEWLNIHECDIVSLEPIRDLSLRELVIGDAPISSLRPVWGMKSLKMIGLSEDHTIDDYELDDFKQTHSKCLVYFI